MKKNLFISMVAMGYLAFFAANGCKKDSGSYFSGTGTAFTEEFDKLDKLNSKGWSFVSNCSVSGAVAWKQGQVGTDKLGPYGFAAYSGAETAYAYCGNPYSNSG